MPVPAAWFDPACRRCPRITANLDAVKRTFAHYHAAPVAPFGDRSARLLIVGLGPGMHGANRTGRPFTGDHAGLLLYETLRAKGLSRGDFATDAEDDLTLIGCRITNAVKCLPPANKPTGAEISNCNAYLGSEIAALPAASVIIALGRVAHDAVLKSLALTMAKYRFSHGRVHVLDKKLTLMDSFHCSRYNTQTGRLTRTMFMQVFDQALALLNRG